MHLFAEVMFSYTKNINQSGYLLNYPRKKRIFISTWGIVN